MSDTAVQDSPPLVEVQRRKIANVLRGAPWIYPNAVRQAPEVPGLVRVVTEQQRFVGWADFNPAAPIPARLLTRDEEWPGEELFLRQRLQRALERRMGLGYGFHAGGLRMVNGEGDGLPGLVIDAYGTTLIYDFYSRAMCERRDLLISIMRGQFADYRHVARMGADAARREGCEPLVPEDCELIFGENGVRFSMQLAATQKTGCYLDQRDNRRLVAHWASGRRVLDLFCYHGGFSLAALASGAQEVLAIDSSQDALDVALANAARNGVHLQIQRTDVFSALPDMSDEAPFDMIICDPPKLAPGRKDRAKGLKAYRHLCRQCLRLLAPGGVLMLSSCSQVIDSGHLLDILSQTASRQGKALDVVAVTQHPADHPWPVGFLTGRYLSTVFVEYRGEL